MNKSMKSLRQVNLFSGQPERRKNVVVKAKKKVVGKAALQKKEMTKNLVRNFFENQLMLPVINSVISDFSREKLLPLLPNEYLKKGIPEIVTKHRATRVSDSLDDRLTNGQTRRSVFKNTWTDEHIVVVHSELLYESLSVLTQEGLPGDKLDVIEWIFAEDTLMWHGRRVAAETIPFSFQTCCKLCGYDYAILQDFILSKLTPEYKQLINFKKAA